MGYWARQKSRSGSVAPLAMTITGTTTLQVSDSRDLFLLNGASTPIVSTINATGPIYPGRCIRFQGKIGMTAPVVFTHNADTVTKGQMELGSGNITLSSQDVLELVQNATGAWTRQFSTVNA